MFKVGITVLKKLMTGDVVKRYWKEGEKECPMFKVGDKFTVENLNMPEGFCSWAWADIQRDVAALALGGNAPWIKDEGVMISCCTDGLRPVVFKLERVKE